MFPYKKPHNWSEQQYQLAIRIHTFVHVDDGTKNMARVLLDAY